jgi:hypothetical protein
LSVAHLHSTSSNISKTLCFCLGCKADCFTFYYGTVDNDGYAELSTYRWSCPPGLYEKADEIRQAIQDAHKAIGTIEK